MADFWLGVCDLGAIQPATGSMAEPLLVRDLRWLAVEVIRLVNRPGTAADDFAVLLSGADGKPLPESLDCRIGFINNARACLGWRDRGFPFVDAEITLDAAGMLTVRTPYYGSPGAQRELPELIRLGPVAFSSDANSQMELAPVYRQEQIAPDSAQPATLVRGREALWLPERSEVVALRNARLELKLAEELRSPSLKPLAEQTYPLSAAWSGEVKLPTQSYDLGLGTHVTPRVDVFGVPVFRFDDVEAIGFRIDLPRDAGTRAELRKLIRALNFHRAEEDRSQVPDFRYEPVGASLVVELLRYGKMRLLRQDAPLTLDDFQSQHELVVRLVVGRVDDDSDRARGQAVFVPAIFVDNPWSKIVGRDIQAIPKALAGFCIRTDQGWLALNPDGRRPDRQQDDEAPEPLASIGSIRLRETTGTPPQDEMLSIECNPAWCQGWDSFEQVSPGSAIAQLALDGSAWRWFDLSRLSYLAQFARIASGQLFNGFRSVQASPLGAQPLGRAWVTGRFTVDELVSLSIPVGSVRLAFACPPGAPAGWKKVCRLLAGRPYYDLHTADWYRLKFSMTMSVDNGLAWAD